MTPQPRTRASLVSIQFLFFAASLLTLFLPWCFIPAVENSVNVQDSVEKWQFYAGWYRVFTGVYALFILTCFSISLMERFAAISVRFFHYGFFLATFALAYYDIHVLRSGEPGWGYFAFLFFASNFFATSAILSSGFLKQLKSGG